MFSNRCCSNRQNMFGFGMNQGFTGTPMMEQQVVEPTITKCVEQEFYHEVPHVCPINTRIINNHIYRHTYQPRYTCCEENVVTQQQCGSCCNFR